MRELCFQAMLNIARKFPCVLRTISIAFQGTLKSDISKVFTQGLLDPFEYSVTLQVIDARDKSLSKKSPSVKICNIYKAGDC